jgi:site-specific recombinase XerD
VAIPEAQTAADKKLQEYIINALLTRMPSLVPFTFENATTIELAKHLLRHRTGSPATLYQYIYGVHRFSKWLNTQPDQLIKACQDQDGDPKPKALAQTSRMLDDFIANLQAENLAPGSVSNHVKGVKALFRCNGLKLELPYSLSKRSVYEDRAPAPEELQHLLDIADLRERVMITLLALGGFRLGTLSKLQYRHVKRDLERVMIPIHVHVEAEIAKGKYHDYDTFLNHEAAEYLKAYLDSRRKGSPTGRKQPEIIHDDSPLIRDGQSNQAKPITTGRMHSVVHNLYVKAGLVTSNPRGRRYDLRAHSIRKFFRTQLASRCPNRLHRVYDGSHYQHLPRHTNERHRIPTRHLHDIEPKHKTQNQSKSNRRTKRNNPRMGTKPRRSTNPRSPVGASQNPNRPEPNRTTPTSAADSRTQATND